jgi:hypothetical protein
MQSPIMQICRESQGVDPQHFSSYSMFTSSISNSESIIMYNCCLSFAIRFSIFIPNRIDSNLKSQTAYLRLSLCRTAQPLAKLI